jgi:isochorismate synthase
VEVNPLENALAAWNADEDFALAVLPFADDARRTPLFFAYSSSGLTNKHGDAWLALPFDDQASFSDIASSRNEHISKVQKAIGAIQNGELEKVVLSRIMRHERAERSNLDTLALWGKLVEKYPHAFVYLLVSRQWGTWMGATPERLVVKKEGRFHTVSLAGTQKVDIASAPVSWGEKEVKEQQVVTDFILDSLVSNGFSDIHTEGPFTFQAGPVAHLKTDIRFSGAQSLDQVIETLQPTPAVCGYPRKAALAFIREQEEHHRALYAGAIGIRSASEEHRVFVNLRCMRVLPTADLLYVGGGIMGNSVAEAEWLETENKAQTLLSLL